MPEMGVSKVVTVRVMTTTERDALEAVEGMVIFNSTTDQLEEYDGSVWQAVGQVIMDTHEALTEAHGSSGNIIGRTTLDIHIADLDAHTKNVHEVLRTGEYHNLGLGALQTRILVANTLYAVPFIAARAMTADRIAVTIDAAAAAGKKIRLGIYNDGTNLYPGTLLLDAGTVDADDTGVKAVTIDQALTKGIYWLALVSDGTPILHGQSQYYNLPRVLGLQSTDFPKQNTGWTVAFTYAALPDPFTTGGSIDVGNMPAIALRFSSMD